MPLFPSVALRSVDVAPPAPPAPSAVVAPVPASCLPPAVLRGATVIALGAYAGDGAAMPFMLSGSRNLVHRIAVTGAGSGPVVLVVAAYEPTLWDLSAVKGRVKAVIASGYYPQAVIGAGDDAVLRFSSSVGTFSGGLTCGKVRYAYDKTDEIERMAADIKQAIGVKPRIFYGRYSAGTFNLDGRGPASPNFPELKDVKAAVPLVTEDDPQRGYEMRALPSRDDQTGPKARVIEWNAAGTIVRDEGGPKPEPSYLPPERTPSWPSSKSSSSSSAGWIFLRFMLIAVIGFAALGIWSWKRSRRRALAERLNYTLSYAYPPVPPAAPLPSPVPIAPPSSPHEGQLRELTSLAALASSEPLVVALHRYGRELRGLSRDRLDPDLGDEAAAITDRHFVHAAIRYRQARPSLDGAEAELADESLRHAVERLAGRLQELRAAQHHRELAGIDEAARFIAARHPR